MYKYHDILNLYFHICIYFTLVAEVLSNRQFRLKKLFKIMPNHIDSDYH